MKNISCRRADLNDAELYFEWANDIEVRSNSYRKDVIKWEDHIKWFQEKVQDEKSVLLIFFDNLLEKAIGQVRLQ